MSMPKVSMWGSGPNIELEVAWLHEVTEDQSTLLLRQAMLEELDREKRRWLLRLPTSNGQVGCISNRSESGHIFWLGVPPAFVADADKSMPIDGTPPFVTTTAEATLGLLRIGLFLRERSQVRWVRVASEEQTLPERFRKAPVDGVFVQRSLLVPMPGPVEWLVVSSLGA